MSAVVETNPWPEAKVAELRKLWDAGLSCSQIAKEIGGTSRNAVIGKVHRLGLSGRVNPTVVRVQKQRDHKAEYARCSRSLLPASRPLPPRDYLKRALQIDVPPSLNYAVADLGRFDEAGPMQCRYPTSSNGAQHLFCGNATEAGPWCPAHQQIVCAPAEERRKARTA